MYSGSSSFNTANKKGQQKHKLRGTVGTVSFTDDNIMTGSLNVTKTNSDGSDIKVGATFVGSFSCTFLKNLSIGPRSWIGKKITLEYGLCVSENPDTYEWMPVGNYTIAEASIGLEGVAVKAYDNMSKFDKYLPDDYVVSGSLYQILMKVCNACDVVLGMTSAQVSSLPNGTQPLGMYQPNDCSTYRDILYWLSQVVGGWADITRAGELVLKTYPLLIEEDVTLDEDIIVNDASFSSWVTSFGSCVFDNEDGTQTLYGSSGTGITYHCGLNPFLIYGTQAVRDTMRTTVLNHISAVRYQPFKVTLMQAPVYDLGDIIYFEGDIAGSESYVGIVNKVTISNTDTVTIEGFGSNPNLQSTKSESERAAAQARSSSSDKETEHYIKYNQNDITIGSAETLVTDILFSANKPTVVEMWHEYLLDTTLTASSMEVEASYYLDLVELERHPKETYTDSASHILDLHYATFIQDAGSHEWEVKLEATGGTCFLGARQGLTVLKGQGLASADKWNGVILLSDDVESFAMADGHMVINDTVDIDIVDLSHRMSLHDMVDHINMVLNMMIPSETFNIYLSILDSIPYCGEGYYCGTEGVLL